MRSKRVCQERDVNISLIIVIDSACRCLIFPNIINNPEHYHNKIIYIPHYHLISFINLFTLINDRHQLIDKLIVLMCDKPGLISGHKALVRNFQNHDF